MGWEMSVRDLEGMPLDDLWSLHERIVLILERKLMQETFRLREKLNKLGRTFRAPADSPQRRPYPKVEQKFKHPEDKKKTWSGRGKQPRWVMEFLASGRSLEECTIISAAS
jgi:DNA-binding protein H-NS